MADLIRIYIGGDKETPAKAQPMEAGTPAAAALEQLFMLDGQGALRDASGVLVARTEKKLKAGEYSFFPAEPGSVQNKIIQLADISMEGEVMEIAPVKFSGSQSFRDFLARSGSPGLRQRNTTGPKLYIIDYDEVQAGAEYSLETTSLSKKIKQQGQQLTHVQQAQEDEMGPAMLRGLRQAGFARNPQLANDLRVLTYDNEPGQEFDVVILDGTGDAFLGWHKTFAKNVKHVYDLEAACEELMSRAAATSDGQYARFKNRNVGLCYMAEKVNPKQMDRLAAKCHERGIIQFCRNGHDISIQNQQLRQPRSKRLPLRKADVMRRPEARFIVRKPQMVMQI